MSLLHFLLLLFTLGVAANVRFAQASRTRNMPVVGILLQESDPKTKEHGDTYFQDNYVKYLQSGGAKVVPVRINETMSYYTDLMSKINGVLFPGGGVNILTSGYARAAQVIYKLAIQYNDAGSYFPLWGTCLGFELLTALRTGKNLLTDCHAENMMAPLVLTQSWLSSKIFAMADRTIPLDLIQHNLTANFHQECVTPGVFNSTAELRDFFRPLATSKDKNGLEYVAMMEAFRYPFYGSQWHPEKNSFDMGYQDNVTHSYMSARVAQYFANYFVAEARKSDHQYPTMEEEAKAIIENYHPVFLGPPTFHNYYFFNYTKTDTEDEYLRFKMFVSLKRVP